jgi:hypothetical protein
VTHRTELLLRQTANRCSGGSFAIGALDSSVDPGGEHLARIQHSFAQLDAEGQPVTEELVGALTTPNGAALYYTVKGEPQRSRRSHEAVSGSMPCIRWT